MMFKFSNTVEAQTRRVRKLMQMHRDGYDSKTIRKQCGLCPSEGFKSAERLGIPWTGKPIKCTKPKTQGGQA